MNIITLTHLDSTWIVIAYIEETFVCTKDSKFPSIKLSV